ncbi:MAG: DUF4190 domain-containing protein [Clostridia bacterium]|nr:DUF4190 domain-containing protein [Clostridia bacterium]
MNTDFSSELRKQNNAMTFATLSLVFGVISLFSTCCCLPFIFSGIGITFALLSKRKGVPYSSFAKSGIITSVIGIILPFVIMIVILFSAMTTLKSEDAKQQFLDAYYEQYENQFHEEMPEDLKEEFENNVDILTDFFQDFPQPE